MIRVGCILAGHRMRPDPRWVLDRDGEWAELWMFEACQRCPRRRFCYDTGRRRVGWLAR